jgi:hypothetical protein
VTDHEQLAAGQSKDRGGPGATADPAGREPAWYAIRVAGALPAAPDARLQGFRLTTTTTSTGDLTTTELVGEVPDQGALIRLLRALHEQGLALLDLVRLPTPIESGDEVPRS